MSSGSKKNALLVDSREESDDILPILPPWNDDGKDSSSSFSLSKSPDLSINTVETTNTSKEEFKQLIIEENKKEEDEIMKNKSPSPLPPSKKIPIWARPENNTPHHDKKATLSTGSITATACGAASTHSKLSNASKNTSVSNDSSYSYHSENSSNKRRKREYIRTARLVNMAKHQAGVNTGKRPRLPLPNNKLTLMDRFGQGLPQLKTKTKKKNKIKKQKSKTKLIKKHSASSQQLTSLSKRKLKFTSSGGNSKQNIFTTSTTSFSPGSETTGESDDSMTSHTNNINQVQADQNYFNLLSSEKQSSQKEETQGQKKSTKKLFSMIRKSSSSSSCSSSLISKSISFKKQQNHLQSNSTLSSSPSKIVNTTVSSEEEGSRKKKPFFFFRFDKVYVVTTLIVLSMISAMFVTHHAHSNNNNNNNEGNPMQPPYSNNNTHVMAGRGDEKKDDLEKVDEQFVDIISMSKAPTPVIIITTLIDDVVDVDIVDYSTGGSIISSLTSFSSSVDIEDDNFDVTYVPTPTAVHHNFIEQQQEHNGEGHTNHNDTSATTSLGRASGNSNMNNNITVPFNVSSAHHTTTTTTTSHHKIRIHHNTNHNTTNEKDLSLSSSLSFNHTGSSSTPALFARNSIPEKNSNLRTSSSTNFLLQHHGQRKRVHVVKDDENHN